MKKYVSIAITYIDKDGETKVVEFKRRPSTPFFKDIDLDLRKKKPGGNLMKLHNSIAPEVHQAVMTWCGENGVTFVTYKLTLRTREFNVTLDCSPSRRMTVMHRRPPSREFADVKKTLAAHLFA